MLQNKHRTLFKKGKWVAVGGNRWIDKDTAKKVGLIVRRLIKAKCKIVTGGAEGVDHEVLKACLKYKIPKKSLKVFLPYTIEEQFRHYRKLEGSAKAKELLLTLLKINELYKSAVVENRKKFKNYRKAADFRNSLIVKQASAAVIFKPKRSIGTLDALKKIKSKKVEYIIIGT